MTNYLALYRGPSITKAKLIAVSVDVNLISMVAEQMLAEANRRQAEHEADPVLRIIQGGQQDALGLLLQGDDAEL